MPSFIGQIKFLRIEPLVLRAEGDAALWGQIYPESSPAPAAQPSIYDQVFTQSVPTYNQPQTVQTTYVPAPVQNPSNPYWQTPAASPSPFLMQPAPWDSGVPGAPAPVDMFSPAPLDRVVPRTDPDTGKPYMETDGVFAGLDPADMTEPVVDLNAPEAANQGVKPTIMVDGQLAPDWRQRMAASPDAKVEAGDAPPGDYAALTDDPRQPFMLAGSDEGKAPSAGLEAVGPKTESSTGTYGLALGALGIAPSDGELSSAADLVSENFLSDTAVKASAARTNFEQARQALIEEAIPQPSEPGRSRSGGYVPGADGQIKAYRTPEQIAQDRSALGARLDSGKSTGLPVSWETYKTYLDAQREVRLLETAQALVQIPDSFSMAAKEAFRNEVKQRLYDDKVAERTQAVSLLRSDSRIPASVAEAVVDGIPPVGQREDSKPTEPLEVPETGNALRDRIAADFAARSPQAFASGPLKENQARLAELRALPADKLTPAQSAELTGLLTAISADGSNKAIRDGELRMANIERAATDPRFAGLAVKHGLVPGPDGNYSGDPKTNLFEVDVAEAFLESQAPVSDARVKATPSFGTERGNALDGIRKAFSMEGGLDSETVPAIVRDYRNAAGLIADRFTLSDANLPVALDATPIGTVDLTNTTREQLDSVRQIFSDRGREDMVPLIDRLIARKAAGDAVTTGFMTGDLAVFRSASKDAVDKVFVGRKMPPEAEGLVSQLKLTSEQYLVNKFNTSKMQLDSGDISRVQHDLNVSIASQEATSLLTTGLAGLRTQAYKSTLLGDYKLDGSYEPNYQGWAAVGGLLLAFLQPLERAYYRKEDEKDKEKWWEKEKAWEREKAQMQQDFWLERQGALEAGDDDDGGGGVVAAVRPARF